jgi:hypothetical protein
MVDKLATERHISHKPTVSRCPFRSRPRISNAKQDQMSFKAENPIDKNITKEVALLEKRSYEIYRENMALEEQINMEKHRQNNYEKMKVIRGNLLAKIVEQEQVRLLAIQAELSRQSALMEAEVLQAQKAADAKHENEDDTAKE